MIEINLIPDVKQELIRAQRTRTTVVTFSIFAGLAALALVVLLLFYVFAVQTVRTVIADDAIKKDSKTLSEFSDLPAMLTLQNQLDVLEILNENKRIDSRIFDMLTAVIPPQPHQIQISSIELEAETDQITISGETPNYDSVEIFKKTIEGADVVYADEESTEVTEALAQEISISDISYGEDASGQKVVRFTITLIYPEALLAASTGNVSFRLSNAGNVTDSYLGIPFLNTTGGSN